MSREPLQPGQIGKVGTQHVRPGVWRANATYADPAGNRLRVRKSGRTQAAARDALLAEIHARLDLDSGGLVSEGSVITKAIDIYFDHRSEDARAGIGRASVRSIRQYRSRVDNWIVPALGNLQVRHLTPGKLDRFFRVDVPPSRYADTCTTLHAFVKWLIVHGARSRDPMAALPSYQRRNIARRSKDHAITPVDVHDGLPRPRAVHRRNRMPARGGTRDSPARP